MNSAEHILGVHESRKNTKKKPHNCKPAESSKQSLDMEGVVCLKYLVQHRAAAGWFS